jgi:3-hydroxybutyrate dehydrogenase
MLKGKTALVTSSTNGIGLAIAKALAGQGADIVLNGFGDAEAAEHGIVGFTKSAALERATPASPATPSARAGS